MTINVKSNKNNKSNKSNKNNFMCRKEDSAMRPRPFVHARQKHTRKDARGAKRLHLNEQKWVQNQGQREIFNK